MASKHIPDLFEPGHLAAMMHGGEFRYKLPGRGITRRIQYKGSQKMAQEAAGDMALAFRYFMESAFQQIHHAITQFEEEIDRLQRSTDEIMRINDEIKRLA